MKARIGGSKRKLASEGLALPLPPALELRAEIERAMDRLAELRSERDVRDVVRRLSAMILAFNAHPIVDGPPSTLMPLDVDAVVSRWKSS